MPARPPVPHVVKEELLITNGGVPAACILHVGYSSAPPLDSDLDTFNASLKAYFTGAWPTVMGVDVILQEIKLTDLSSDIGATSSVEVGVAGLEGADPAPASACQMVNWTIARRYRGGHPRTYFPPGNANNFADPSHWLDSQLAAMSDFVNGYVAAVTAKSFGTLDTTTPVNVSYFSGNALRVAPVVDPITGFSLSNIIRTQRRRLTASSY